MPGTVIRHKTKAEIDAALRLAAEREAARQTMTFQIGSFNVLGSQHSTRSGDHSRYPPASVRSPRAVERIRSFGVDILGTQELQPDQLNAIQAMTGYAAYPGYAFGPMETDNTIFYDDSRFEFVSGSSFTIHFMHANRPQTILRLRDKETGREFYVLNMHASAGFGPYAVTRRAGHYTAAATVNRLKADGIPIFLTGDMNDRAEFFCRVAPLTGMVAAIGGSTAGGCHPAGALAVDWVLGLGQRQLQQLHRGPQHHADGQRPLLRVGHRHGRSVRRLTPALRVALPCDRQSFGLRAGFACDRRGRLRRGLPAHEGRLRGRGQVG